jgi:hypothetical protein
MMRILVVILGMILSVTLSYGTEPPLGFVTDMDLQGKDATNSKGLKLFAPLVVQDEIKLSDPKSFVVIALANGEVKVTSANSPFVLKNEKAIAREEWTLISAIGQIFGGDGSEQVPDNMVARGGTLEIPMMAARTNYVDGNRRQLWFGWVGGKAPFKVTIEFPNASQIVAGIDNTDIEINLAQALPKQIFVSIVDAKGTLKRFRIRSAGVVPKAPTQIGRSVFANASWLMKQNEGKWRLETAQMLRAGNRTARIIADKIALGALP